MGNNCRGRVRISPIRQPQVSNRVLPLPMRVADTLRGFSGSPPSLTGIWKPLHTFYRSVASFPLSFHPSVQVSKCPSVKLYSRGLSRDATCLRSWLPRSVINRRPLCHARTFTQPTPPDSRKPRCSHCRQISREQDRGSAKHVGDQLFLSSTSFSTDLATLTRASRCVGGTSRRQTTQD